MLQQHSSLKTIKKKLIRKALDMIRRIADQDPDEFKGTDKGVCLYFNSQCVKFSVFFLVFFCVESRDWLLMSKCQRAVDI